MRLTTRLFVYGGLVPASLMVVGFVATGYLLRAHLVEDTDRELLTQAAVESVSLFDGPDGRPHLHLARSPLSAHVQGFMPEGALYDQSGARVVSTAPTSYAPRSLTSAAREGVPMFTTTRRGRSTVRELRVAVASPRGDRYLLWVGTPLDAVGRTMTWYTRTAAIVVLVSVFLSVLVQRRHAGSLAARLDRLAQHMAGLRAGRFDVPPTDTTGDVIADLRDAIAETTARLRIARDTQERFVADAAHELRTPLTAMRTLIDTTLRRERSTADLREALETTRDEVNRLTTLSNELLDRATLAQTDFASEVLDVPALVREAIDGARPLAEARAISFEQAVAPLKAHVRAVPHEVRRALDNLLANAVKFAPRGSTVRVDVALKRGRLCFVVADEGEGVPASEAESIFEPFNRGPRNAERGAGLGLAIVRDIARRHGGDAWVESAGGAHSRFAFDLALPAAERGEVS